MMKIFTLITTTLISISAIGQCVSDEGNVYSFTYAGANYEIIKENKTWTDAAACAVERGGYLVEINSLEEQDTVFHHVNLASITASSTVAPDGGGASYLWLGGNDLETEGTWIWDGNNDGTGPQFWMGTSTGSAVGGLYNNWEDEPDDFSGQDGLAIAFTNWPLGSAGQWNDIDETNSIYFIVEYVNTTGVEDQSLDYKLYPNPADDHFVLDGDFENETYQILNLQGQVLVEGTLNGASPKVNCETLATDTYVIFLPENGSTIKFNVTKQ